jgi:hypothetical protein
MLEQCGYFLQITLKGQIMYFDRFDICEAYFLALSHCHGGQWSTEYARLCKLMRYFKPSPFLSVDSLTENARVIYDNACEKMLRGAA